MHRTSRSPYYNPDFQRIGNEQSVPPDAKIRKSNWMDSMSNNKKNNNDAVVELSNNKYHSGGNIISDSSTGDICCKSVIVPTTTTINVDAASFTEQQPTNQHPPTAVVRDPPPTKQTHDNNPTPASSTSTTSPHPTRHVMICNLFGGGSFGDSPFSGNEWNYESMGPEEFDLAARSTAADHRHSAGGVGTTKLTAQQLRQHQLQLREDEYQLREHMRKAEARRLHRQQMEEKAHQVQQKRREEEEQLQRENHRKAEVRRLYYQKLEEKTRLLQQRRREAEEQRQLEKERLAAQRMEIREYNQQYLLNKARMQRERLSAQQLPQVLPDNHNNGSIINKQVQKKKKHTDPLEEYHHSPPSSASICGCHTSECGQSNSSSFIATSTETPRDTSYSSGPRVLLDMFSASGSQDVASDWDASYSAPIICTSIKRHKSSSGSTGAETSKKCRSERRMSKNFHGNFDYLHSNSPIVRRHTRPSLGERPTTSLPPSIPTSPMTQSLEN